MLTRLWPDWEQTKGNLLLVFVTTIKLHPSLVPFLLRA